MKERIDRSNDPYYQGMFWCYEAQQFFRWEEMQDWYEEHTQADLVGAPL